MTYYRLDPHTVGPGRDLATAGVQMATEFLWV